MKTNVNYITPVLQSDIKFKKIMICETFYLQSFKLYLSVLLKSVTYRIIIVSGGSIVKFREKANMYHFKW